MTGKRPQVSDLAASSAQDCAWLILDTLQRGKFVWDNTLAEKAVTEVLRAATLAKVKTAAHGATTLSEDNADAVTDFSTDAHAGSTPPVRKDGVQKSIAQPTANLISMT